MEKQPHLDMSTRRLLIDWLVQAQEEFNMHTQCLHLAVVYIDRFLSKMAVVKHKLQLVGVAAMSVAGKLEEIRPPLTKQWCDATVNTYTSQQVKGMEKLLLDVLDFQLQPPTALVFIELLCNEFKMDSKIFNLAMVYNRPSLKFI